MFAERLAALLESWKKAFGQYKNYKAMTEAAVVRWEWTTRERYSALPFHFKRFPGRGRVLKDTPTSAGVFNQYGFDQQGRVQVHRLFQFRALSPGNFLQRWVSRIGVVDGLYSETFYQYSEDRTEWVEFSVSPHIPLSFQQIFISDNLVVFYDQFKLNGYTPRYGQKGKNPDELYTWLGVNGRFKTAEEYIYDGRQLSMISGYYEAPGLSPYTAREQLVYDETGELLLIDRILENGQKQVVYRRRKKGQTFRAIRDEMTRKLTEAIVQRVKAASIQEKVYCIQLYYQKGIQHFPPHVIPAPESYRLQILQSADPAARYGIFFPVLDDRWFFEIDDPQTLELCQVLEQEIHDGEKWDTATSILQDVAAALTRYDWSNILTITPDFVVFALDPEMEGDHLEDCLGKVASKKQIQEWKDKGWLD